MSDTLADPIDLHRVQTLAEAAIAAATAAGADAADAVALVRVSLSTTVRNGVVEEAESAEESDLGLRVFVGKRTALVGIGPRGDASAAAERAVAMARAAPPDETAGLADPGQLAADIDALALGIDDGEAPAMAALTERAQALEAAMLDVAGTTNSGGASASAGRAARWFMATNGFSAGYTTTTHGHGGTAIAGDGTKMERDGWYSTRRHLADLMDVVGVGTLAGERTVRRLNSERLSTRTATVVFEPRAASGFVSHLMSAANGSAVARGASLLAGKLGEKVFGDGITIRDDPGKVRGLASRPFDGEGLAAEPVDVVADGVLSAYVLDLGTARRLGMTSNGRASRMTGAPGPSGTNVTVHGGSGDLAGLMKDAGTGLLVTDLIGMGVNYVNGTYSRGAAGFWFEGGEIVHPVSEITIGGMLRDMFARARFADDAPGYSTTDAPSVMIEGLTIGGS